LRLHAAVLAAVAVCLALGWWQLDRARAGNELSWAYAVEWPFFAAVAVAAWRVLLRDIPDARMPLEVHPVDLTLGPATFGRLAYDSGAGIIHLQVNAAASDVHVERCREGHQLRFDEHGNLVGLTLVGARKLVAGGEPLVITATERIELDAAALAAGLGADICDLKWVWLSWRDRGQAAAGMTPPA
jgi:hypothetical protein